MCMVEEGREGRGMIVDTCSGFCTDTRAFTLFAYRFCFVYIFYECILHESETGGRPPSKHLPTNFFKTSG